MDEGGLTIRMGGNLARIPAVSTCDLPMKPIDDHTLNLLWFDADARDTRLRQLVVERLSQNPAPPADNHVVVTYFLALCMDQLHQAAKEIAYHATSEIKNPPPGSLLAQCTVHVTGVDAWDATGRIGLLHIAFPLKMLLRPDGHLTSCDLLHTVAGAIIFDVYENQDARLVSLQIPEHVLRTFPGPAYGPLGSAARELHARGTGLRHDLEAYRGHHGRRGCGAGCRSGRMSAPAVRQGGRRPLSQLGLFAHPRSRRSGNGGDRAGEGTTARQGADFRPPHHGKGDGLDKRYENQLGYGSDIILIRSQGK